MLALSPRGPETIYAPLADTDGVRWITSPVVSSITAMLNVIFIRLHSLLDYAKLVHEIEHLRSDSSASQVVAIQYSFWRPPTHRMGEAPVTLFPAQRAERSSW